MSCCHLAEFKSSNGLRAFEAIFSCFFTTASPSLAKLKATYGVCKECGSYSGRLHACLHCVYTGCYREKHIHKHSSKTRHQLVVDLSYGQVFCFACQSYVYDAEVEMLLQRKSSETWLKTRIEWIPSVDDQEFLATNPKRRKLCEQSTVGLRGLHNLGNTCFMNCILQALVHTPTLRDFFLADQHMCRYSSGSGTSKSSKCLMCELASLFQEFYKGVSTPLIPYRLLHLVWQNAHHLAGYEQQDAHEFFMAALDILHQHSQDYNPSSDENNGGASLETESIIEKLCTGQLQSDVICQECKCVSTTIDPFWDISLDLGNAIVPTKPFNRMTATNLTPSPTKIMTSFFPADGALTPLRRSPPPQPPPQRGPLLSPTSRTPNTLLECLERFTHPERLGSEAKIKCSTCRTYQESTKQLTLRKIPVILCFHLKRFEHGKKSRKISRFMPFPLELDMGPYMTERGASHNRHSLKNKYCLFAVVNHSGTMETGHYTCYVRQQRDQWFNCDDAWITKVTVSEVLRSEAYLLFYHKQVLDYE
ncbi:ubiquitin carboxyl-terminal hydrolase 22-like [Oscarella lobularis]|uniref:ubiquitin carboxyl-terminal hydrolase 22-like n=1 Tax=Oscarella lobularis TaxID=121494 RepID=UPI00331418B1